MTHDVAEALAQRSVDTLFEAALDWGAAVNAAEAEAPGPSKDLAVMVARLKGTELMRLATGMARILRPSTASGVHTR